MKLLVITSQYPPDHSGGYELRCKGIVDQLILKGYSVEIITNKPIHTFNDVDDKVRRALHIFYDSMSFLSRMILDYRDVRYLDQIITSFRPDLIYLWNTANLTRAIFPYLARLNIPIVFDEGGVGIRRAWQSHGIWDREAETSLVIKVKNKIKNLIVEAVSELSGNLIKKLWSWPIIYAYFNSDMNYKNAKVLNIPLNKEVVIHSGIDGNVFSYKERDSLGLPVRIVTPGRITSPKNIRDCFLFNKIISRE